MIPALGNVSACIFKIPGIRAAPASLLFPSYLSYYIRGFRVKAAAQQLQRIEQWPFSDPVA
jgi:hypothetical protein